MTKINWTDQIISKMKSLINSGFSCSEVASQLSIITGAKVTRNAVIGKNNRLKKEPTKKRQSQREKISKKIKPESPRPVPIEIVNTTRNIPLLDVRLGQCRYITGHLICCGDTVHKGQFCKHHAEVCYR